MRPVRILISTAGCASLVLLAATAVGARESNAERPPTSPHLSSISSCKQTHARRPRRLPLRCKNVAAGPIGISRLGNWYRTSSGYGRYRFMLLGYQDAAKVARLPVVSLIHQSAVDIPTTYSEGVPYREAQARGWLLKDANGNYLKSQAYGYYVGDVGSSGYRRAWLANVAAMLRSTHADGVFIDSVLADIRGFTGGIAPAKYAAQQQWENALRGFIAVVGRGLKARGFYVVASALKNVWGESGVAGNDGGETAAWWRRIGRYVNGLFDEYFQQNPIDKRPRATGSEWYNHWAGWERLISVAQRLHDDFFGYTYASLGNTQLMRYAKASFYLGWNGRGGGLFIDCSCADPWDPSWTTNIGRPNGPKFQVLPNVWRRNYSKGTVVVNPTRSAVTVVVDGAARTLAPQDGLILKR